MSYIVSELNKLYPQGLAGIKIAINDCSPPVQALAITLFGLGATIVVADKKIDNVNALNKQLHPRSGSLLRYRAVSFSTIHLEVVDVIIEISELPKGPLHAKHRIRPKTKATEGPPPNVTK